MYASEGKNFSRSLHYALHIFVLSTADSEHVISTFNRPSHSTHARELLSRGSLFGRNRVDNILALCDTGLYITRMNPHNDHSTSIH